MALTETMLGVVEFGQTLCVSDPGYGFDEWSGLFDLGIKPGRYQGSTIEGEYIFLDDEGKEHNWGTRVWRVMAVKEEETIEEWEFVKGIGVDSATMSIVCATKYEEHHSELWSLIPNEIISATKEEVGFVCGSGLGDGGYGVYGGRNKMGEFCAVSVVFLIPDAEEKKIFTPGVEEVGFDDPRFVEFAHGDWWKTTEHEPDGLGGQSPNEGTGQFKH